MYQWIYFRQNIALNYSPFFNFFQVFNLIVIDIFALYNQIPCWRWRWPWLHSSWHCSILFTSHFTYCVYWHYYTSIWNTCSIVADLQVFSRSVYLSYTYKHYTGIIFVIYEVTPVCMVCTYKYKNVHIKSSVHIRYLFFKFSC